jgi:hypothetical protein
MFVLSRRRHGSAEVPEESIDMAGSTGNIYSVTISLQPTCSCPDMSGSGGQCKHIIYVLKRVLRVEGQLSYQAAFLSSELREIFANAPVAAQGASTEAETVVAGAGRRPIEGDCPICFCEMEEAEETVWCKAACGNSLHASCFQQWAASKGGSTTTCVYCRAPWQESEEEKVEGAKRGLVQGKGRLMKEGYVNVAEELGIGRERGTCLSWIGEGCGVGADGG